MFDLTVELIALGSIIGTYFSAFRFFYKNLWNVVKQRQKPSDLKSNGLEEDLEGRKKELS